MAQVSKEIVKENLLEIAEMSDAHCHLELFKHPLETIEKARKEGVGIIITATGESVSTTILPMSRCFLQSYIQNNRHKI